MEDKAVLKLGGPNTCQLPLWITLRTHAVQGNNNVGPLSAQGLSYRGWVLWRGSPYGPKQQYQYIMNDKIRGNSIFDSENGSGNIICFTVLHMQTICKDMTSSSRITHSVLMFKENLGKLETIWVKLCQQLGCDRGWSNHYDFYLTHTLTDLWMYGFT